MQHNFWPPSHAGIPVANVCCRILSESTICRREGKDNSDSQNLGEPIDEGNEAIEQAEVSCWAEKDVLFPDDRNICLSHLHDTYNNKSIAYKPCNIPLYLSMCL